MTTRLATRSAPGFDRPRAEEWVRFAGPLARLAYEIAVIRSNGATWSNVRWYMAGTEPERLVRACALARSFATRFPVGASR